MNANEAKDNVTSKYQYYLDYALAQIKRRSLNDFFSVNLHEKIWRTDSDMASFVRGLLDSKGYKTSFLTEKNTGRSYTNIRW